MEQLKFELDKEKSENLNLKKELEDKEKIIKNMSTN